MSRFDEQSLVLPFTHTITLATDDLQDSHKHILWLYYEEKLSCMRITYTRFAARTIFFSQLQMTCEIAANMFHGCLARKNYAARELPTLVSQFVLFSHAIFFHKKCENQILCYKNCQY